MPRNISVGLAAHYQSSVLTIANCLKLARKDGVTLGFTTFDEPLTISGVVYEPVGSVKTTALRQSADTGVDNLEIDGLLSTGMSSDLITDSDIRAGRYDNADIMLFQCNYTDLSQGICILLRGKLGQVTMSNGQYKAELLSLSSQMKQYIGDITSPLCRVHRLGDAQCKVNISAYTFSNTVAIVTDAKTLTMSDATHMGTSGDYNEGILRSTNGDNSGLEREIKGQIGTILYLRHAFPYPFVAGNTVQMEKGCDRKWTTCKTKFSNNLNFHAEPHLPGNTTVTQIARPPSR